MTQIENPFKVGEPVPDLPDFYYSDYLQQDDFLYYIQRDRPVTDNSESNRLFELYKKYLHEQQPKS